MTGRSTEYPLVDDPLWFKDVVFYEVHVRTFSDSNADGVGDFNGLTGKLDYLQDLGVTAIWVLPFYPSPLRDDGYDITDYRTINPAYGTMADFRRFLRQAHLRGMRVVTELVINHTSDQNPWFQRARTSPAGSNYRNYYVWSDDPSKYSDARIIFKDSEPSNWTFDPVANSYYWHRFFHHQPDLNFDNPSVQKEIFRLVDYWFGMGVDGLRLDAVPYLFEREGTSCENLPEIHAFLKSLRAHVDAKFSNRMLLAEANQWPEDAVKYFGDGDECHMAFHFPVMPRLFMAIQMEDRFPIIDILRQTPEIPEGAQWGMFLRNHDELTLEMVTDEERDYMYRVYAHDPQARINLGIRRRLAPLLGNDLRQIQLMNALLFSMPGTPVLYYGDEIGMGDNVYLGDRLGVRTPMQWSGDRNGGFSKANPQRLYSPPVIDPGYHYEAVNVESQQANPNLLLWWMKRLIGLRKQSPAFGRGSVEFLYPDNPKVLAFVSTYEDQSILVVANLSRYAQGVQLDMSRFAGSSLIEMFGQSEMPPVTDAPYSVTIGPHDFYWLSISKDAAPASDYAAASTSIPELSLNGGMASLFSSRQQPVLASILIGYVRQRRWFGGKSRRIQGAAIQSVMPIANGDSEVQLTLLRVNYRDGEPETYSLMLGFAQGDDESRVRANYPGAVVAAFSASGQPAGILYDAVVDPEFTESLLQIIQRGRNFRSGSNAVFGTRTRAFAELRGPAYALLQPTVLGVEQSNTSVAYGDRLILKMFRRPGEGVNPDLELGRTLLERSSFRNTALLAGAVEYQRGGASEPTTIAVLQGFIENDGDAWRFTLDNLAQFFERALATQSVAEPPKAHLLESAPETVPAQIQDIAGTYLLAVVTMAKRTAEMHRALASVNDPDFNPEPFTQMYQRSLYASLRAQGSRTFELLGQQLGSLPEGVKEIAARIVKAEPLALSVFEKIRNKNLGGMRIRTHGDFHLGQVLNTGTDFVIIDFEGEPARAVSERRLKRSPLRDVAGMIRSFDYAAQSALRLDSSAFVRPTDVPVLESWAEAWTHWVSATYLQTYLSEVDGSGLLPTDPASLKALLDALVLEKALYELAYDLNSRPDWVLVPLISILRLIRDEE